MLPLGRGTRQIRQKTARGPRHVARGLGQLSFHDDSPVSIPAGMRMAKAADLVVRAVSMTGTGIVLPVVARAAAVRRVLQPWSRTRAVAEVGGCLADITVTGTEG